MHHQPKKNIQAITILSLVASLACFGARGQDTASQTPDKSVAGTAAATVPPVDYTIGPGDLLSITVMDAPEYGGKFRVSDSGMVDIPGIPDSIQAEGQSSIELSRTIRQALMDAKQLRNPKVNVFIEEYKGRTVTVLGAVAKPAVYPLQKRIHLMEALSMAGGALPGAGNSVTIVRGAASAEATGTTEGSVQTILMSRLVKGEDPSANIEIRNGDVLDVAAAQVVYVVGAVVKPGGFVMSDPSAGISAVQAIALAEGFTPTASVHHAVLVRQSTSGKARTEIPLDIGQMQQGKLTDIVLAPNDILFVPRSGAKSTLQTVSQIAAAAVNGIAYYGAGYRVGTVK